MTKEQLLDLVGNFGYDFGHLFFVSTKQGNFIWSDPDYPGGDNIIRRYKGTLKQFCQDHYIPCVRDKGKHIIRDYCGDQVIFVDK